MAHLVIFPAPVSRARRRKWPLRDDSRPTSLVLDHLITHERLVGVRNTVTVAARRRVTEFPGAGINSCADRGLHLPSLDSFSRLLRPPFAWGHPTEQFNFAGDTVAGKTDGRFVVECQVETRHLAGGRARVDTASTFFPRPRRRLHRRKGGLMRRINASNQCVERNASRTLAH